MLLCRRWRSCVLLASIVLACQPPTPTAAPGATATLAVTPSPAATQATPEPSASAVVYLDRDTLPPAPLEDEDATSICDPEAEQFDANAGETVVHCYQGSLLGLRALHTAAPSIDRLYLRRTRCLQVPCSATELNVVTVTGWTGSVALSVVLDDEESTVTAPTSDPTAVWPRPPDAETPAVERPDIPTAPKVVRNREPYPCCGEAPDSDSSPERQCFVAAVLDGRAAEMTYRPFITGPIVILRFDGQVPILAYSETPSTWQKSIGSLVFGITSQQWDYQNWPVGAATIG